jgi:hypothetical protein
MAGKIPMSLARATERMLIKGGMRPGAASAYVLSRLDATPRKLRAPAAPKPAPTPSAPTFRGYAVAEIERMRTLEPELDKQLSARERSAVRMLSGLGGSQGRALATMLKRGA